VFDKNNSGYADVIEFIEGMKILFWWDSTSFVLRSSPTASAKGTATTTEGRVRRTKLVASSNLKSKFSPSVTMSKSPVQSFGNCKAFDLLMDKDKDKNC
jgi:hypothetical protein